jgi:hypothetical protein
VGSHRVFRAIWWATNALLALALLGTLFTGIWEHSVRQYLKGFSDAIIPEDSSPRQKAEAILAWMSYGPPRREAPDTSSLSAHDPTDTLNYRQLLAVCGSATNAFLNLSRSSGLEARRLLLLSPDRTAKHVVAEVHLDGRWVIVDATYREFMKDARGRLLTRADLADPRLFQEAAAQIPGYVSAYSYERVAHIRVGALPFVGPFLRRVLDSLMPGWDESLDWSLLLERRSFAYFFFSVWALLFFLLLRIVLAWLADHRLLIPRLRLRTSLTRATATFFSTPEIK